MRARCRWMAATGALCALLASSGSGCALFYGYEDYGDQAPPDAGGGGLGGGGAGGAGGSAGAGGAGGGPLPTWSRVFAPITDASVSDLAVDSTGAVVVAGVVTAGGVDFGGDVVPFGGGVEGLFAFKLDPKGDHVWTKWLGEGAPGITSLDVDVDAEGNVVIAAFTVGTVDFGSGALVSVVNPDVFVGKLDPDGKEVWSLQAGDPNSQLVSDVRVTPEGEILLAGSFNVALELQGCSPLTTPGSGDFDVFLAKLTKDGVCLTAKQLGGPGDERSAVLEVDEDGEIAFTAKYRGTLDLGNGVTLPQSFATGPDEFDAFAVRLGADLVPQYARRIGYGRGVAFATTITAPGDAILVGGVLPMGTDLPPMPPTFGGSDIVAVKLVPEGDVEWAKIFGGRGAESGRLLGGPNGEVRFIGTFQRTAFFDDLTVTSKGGFDVVIAKLDQDGKVVSAESFGDGQDQSFTIGAWDVEGGLAVAGIVAGTLDLGSAPPMTSPVTAIYVAKLSP